MYPGVDYCACKNDCCRYPAGLFLRHCKLCANGTKFVSQKLYSGVLFDQDIKYFYDITDRGNFKVNPDYKGVCHVALAQEGHTRPGEVG